MKKLKTVVDAVTPASQKPSYWDELDSRVSRFLKQRDFDAMLMFLQVAADRDKEFRELLIQALAGLKKDGHRAWSKTEHHLILVHYAHAVLSHDPDPLTTVCDYVVRVLKRDRLQRATMNNELSKVADRAIEDGTLPDFARAVILDRLATGKKRKHRGRSTRPAR